MKKGEKVFVILLIAAFCIIAILYAGAQALAVSVLKSADEPCLEADYMGLMIEACVSGDTEAGQAAAATRDVKIAMLGLDYKRVDFEEPYLLSKIVYAEAGSNWLSDGWKLCVGEVVLNRVASSEFPDTVREVVYQPGQYYGADSAYFEKLRPDERCVKLAVRLLEGERVLQDASVVFQANFRQGSGTHTKLYDKHLGWTYFCYSSKPELYEER